MPKRAFLASNVSSIISNQVISSIRTLDVSISLIISNHNIHRALFDLGTSVDLLPFIVCERLGLGELKLIKMVL